LTNSIIIGIRIPEAICNHTAVMFPSSHTKLAANNK